MKTLRGVLVAAVLLAMGLLGATAAFAVGELSVNPDASDCPASDPEAICIYFGESGGGTDTVTITNTGDEVVQITGVDLVTYAGDDPLDPDTFQHNAPSVPIILNPTDFVAVDVTWDPSGALADRAILRFSHDADVPSIPIDIHLGGGQSFLLEPAGGILDLGKVNIAQPALDPPQVGMNSHGRIQLRHSGPAFPNVAVAACPTKDPSDAPFTIPCRSADYPYTLTTDDNVLNYRTGFYPDSEVSELATVTFSVQPDGSVAEDVVFNLSGEGVTGDVLYRVNSGGPVENLVSSTQSFTRDEEGIPSAYWLGGAGGASINTASVTPDLSVPTTTPTAIFASDRLEGAGGTPIGYEFPVSDGPYTVRLFFVEVDRNITGAGQRVFDVSIDGSVVIPNLDPYAVAGGWDAAFARAFLVDADDMINIELERPPSAPPVLSGLEIITGGSAELTASDVAFGSVPVGGSDSETLTITNNADPDGAAVRVDGVSLSGSADFDVTGLGTPVWLAPGDTLDQDVTFEPSGTGARAATASFTIHGAAPFEVDLTGSGDAVNEAPVAANDAYQTDEDTPLVVAAPGVLGNDTDADGNTLSAVLAAGPIYGSVELDADGGLTYTPDAGFFGTDSFTYRANDGLANSNLATVTITINEGEGEEEPDDVSFVDIDGSTFTQDILWLAKVGITRGCNPPVNDRFCPDDFVTRGQMAAFFVRGLDLTDRLDDPFVDDDGDTFEADIERLAAADITRGCNPPVNDRFCPDDFVTRGQMAAFFHRAADLLGLPG